MAETNSGNPENADRETVDQLAFQNPVTRYPVLSPPKQDQPEPGLDVELEPRTDRGELSYRGTGRLEGRKALITGADSGIGAAVAIAFAKEGADVALNYLPDEEPDAQVVKAAIEKAGRTAVLLPGDLTDKDFCAALVENAVDGLGGLDILVNNAGKQVAVESLEDLSDEQLVDTFTVNIVAMFRITKAALRHLPAGSSIINTTSIQAYQPSPDLLDYASTKAAINNFTVNLAAEVGERGIRVNAVAPGPIWTPLQPATQPEKKIKAFVYLASPAEASYVSGTVLGVTGGKPVF